jgi:hypothetical protein
VTQDRLWLAIRKLPRQFGSAVHRVQRDDDGADLPSTENRQYELRRVLKNDCHAIARADTLLRPPSRETIAKPIKFAVRESCFEIK